MDRTEKLLKCLRGCKRISSERLRKEMGFYNVAKYVKILRDKGHIIYTVQNTRTDIQYEYVNHK